MQETKPYSASVKAFIIAPEMENNNMTLTRTRLQELLSYNPETGLFNWKVAAARRIKVGQDAGSVNSEGYLHIRIDGEGYKVQRLAWLHFYGVWPTGVIDHINGIKDDNRLANLRDVSRRENASNMQRHREGHLVGTCWDKRRNMWLAGIKINGKREFLGYHLTQELASQAYQKALFNIIKGTQQWPSSQN